ncbi:methyltransferase domain-containing protein [Candidatus Gottesmanbacteria bacterium]|nr:methyltransferase domain-containing protein [Candidatus Gottesmanbacteria bacterium]
MTTEIQIQPLQVETSIPGYLVQFYLPIPPIFVDRIIADEQFTLPNGQSTDFIKLYRSISGEKLIEKFNVARALIEDGRYPDPHFLLDNFPIKIKSEEESTVDGELQTKLQDGIRLLMMQKGFISPEDSEAKKVEESLFKFVESDGDLSQLNSVVPRHVISALTSLRAFGREKDQGLQFRLLSRVVHSFIRPYVGNLSVQRPTHSIDINWVIQHTPENVFREDTDNIAANMVKSYFRKEVLKLLNSPEDGWEKLEQLIRETESPFKRGFLEDLYKEQKEEVANLVIPPVFQTETDGWFTDRSPFPLHLQKHIVHKTKQTGRKYWNGETGSGKTGTFYLLAEAMGIKRGTIIAPAKARNTWVNQATKHYLPDSRPDVFVVRRERDITNSRIVDAKYVILGTEFLAQCWSNPEKYESLLEALRQRGTDGLGFDESDFLRHPSTNTVQIIDSIISSSPKPKLMVALTATPIVSEVADMDVTMALLYPERFSYPGRETNGKSTFSVTCKKDPKAAFLLLHGEELMLQWGLEDLYGEKVPELKYEREHIPLSPHQNVLYEFVSDLPINFLTKVNLLSYVLTDPELIKKPIKKLEVIPADFTITQEEALTHLDSLYEEWMNWSIEKDPKLPDEPFSADWIAKYGDKDFLIKCFFSEDLTSGVDSVAGILSQKISRLKKDWKPQLYPSGKYEWIINFLEQAHKRGEKTHIISPIFKEGITTYDDEVWSLLATLKTHFSDLPDDSIVGIDGSMPPEKREEIGKISREDGKRFMDMVISMESTYQSIDLAPRDMPNINGVNVVWLGWPWEWVKFRQYQGRYNRPRPGRQIPVNTYVLMSDGTIDRGQDELVHYKKLISEVALHGIMPTPEQEKLLKKPEAAEQIVLLQPNIGQVFLRTFMASLAGRGEVDFRKELEQTKDGRSVFERFAEAYFDGGNDEWRLVGNNAELIKNIAVKSNPKKMLSVGAGTCLFARKVAKSGYPVEIDNVDINRAVLELAKREHPEIGNIVVEGATNLSAGDNSYDVIDVSFMFHYTKLYEDRRELEFDEDTHAEEIERVKALSEIHRVAKDGATIVLSFPVSTLDNESFIRFTSALQNHFGFTVDEPTGESYTTDVHPPRRIGWVITLKKTGVKNFTNMNLHDLAFATDALEYVSQYKGKKSKQRKTVRIEHAILSAKNFRIVNPVNGNVTIEQSAASYIPPTTVIDNSGIIFQSQEIVVDGRRDPKEMKHSLNTEQLRVFNMVRKRLQEIPNSNDNNKITYKQAERQVIEAIINNGLDKLDNWYDDEGGLQRNVYRVFKKLIGKF